MITADDIRHIKEYVKFLQEELEFEGAPYGGRKEAELNTKFMKALQNCEDQVRYNTAQAYRLLPGV